MANKGKKFSKAEDQQILLCMKKFGKRWDLIANCVPGRTAQMIKNRYYYSLKNE